MEAGEILEIMFELEYDFAVPDVLYEQELLSQESYLTLGLIQIELTEESMTEVVRIKQDGAHKSISTNDLFALCLAKQENSRLITGDGQLRRLSESEGVQVHGTVWIIEQMLNANVITCDQCERSYQLMRDDGSRLPWDDIDEQINRHRNNEQ